MARNNLLAEVESVGDIAVVHHGTVTPMVLIEKAMSDGASLERMEQLFALQLRWEENEAKKAFHKAVAAFKSEAIEILKTKKVSYKTNDGNKTEYDHATLGNIVEIVTPKLGKHGLSHAWDMNQEGSKITVTCTLTHALGHSKSVQLEAAPDASGKKNAIQQVASTVTYLQRYTFLAITGLAAKDQDDDGKASEEETTDLITADQGMDIEALITEVGANEKAFCAYYKINHIYQLPASKLDSAIKKLEAKRKEQ